MTTIIPASPRAGHPCPVLEAAALRQRKGPHVHSSCVSFSSLRPLIHLHARVARRPWQLRKWQPAYVGLATSALPTHSEFPWPRKNPSVFQRRRWLLSQPSLSRGYHAAQCVPWYAWRPPGDGSSSCSISSVPKQPRGRN